MNTDHIRRAAALDPQDPRAQREAQRLILRERGAFEEERTTLPVWRDFKHCEARDKSRYWDCLAHLWIVSPVIGRQLHAIDRMREAKPLLENAGRTLCSYTFRARDCAARIDEVPEKMDWGLPPGDSRRDWRLVLAPWSWMTKPNDYEYCGTFHAGERLHGIQKLNFKFRRCLFCRLALDMVLGRTQNENVRIKKSDADMLHSYFADRHGEGGTEKLIFGRTDP